MRFARAQAALGGEHAHAVASPGVDDAFVDVGIVGRPIGHASGNARVDDGGGHHLPIGEVTGDEDGWLSRSCDAEQPLAPHHLHPPVRRREPIGEREFEERAAEVVPLRPNKFRSRLRAELGKGEIDIALDDPRRRGQGAQNPEEPSPEAGHPFDWKKPNNGAGHIVSQRLKAPDQFTARTRALFSDTAMD